MNIPSEAELIIDRLTQDVAGKAQEAALFRAKAIRAEAEVRRLKELLPRDEESDTEDLDKDD